MKVRANAIVSFWKLGFAFLFAISTVEVTSPERCEACHAFVWSVSNSPVDPTYTVGPASGGEIELYLWLWCALHGGMQAAEFGLDGSIAPLSFTPSPGFQNSGTATDLRLTSENCPEGNSVVGIITAIEPIEGGELCFVPSSSGMTTTTPCPPEDPTPQEFGLSGYSSLGILPCSFHFDCAIDSVDGKTWGKIKAEYR